VAKKAKMGEEFGVQGCTECRENFREGGRWLWRMPWVVQGGNWVGKWVKKAKMVPGSDCGVQGWQGEGKRFCSNVKDMTRD
jgi:hypothetical protein